MVEWTDILKTVQQVKGKNNMTIKEPDNVKNNPSEGSESLESKPEKCGNETSDIKPLVPPVHDFSLIKSQNMLTTEKIKLYWNLKSSILKASRPSGSVTQPEGIPNVPEPPRYITSEKFAFVEASGRSSEWAMIMNPCFMNNGVQYVSFYLWMCGLDALHDFVDVTYDFVVLSEEGPSVYQRGMTGIKRFTRTNCTFGWSMFLPARKFGSHPPEIIRLHTSMMLYSDVQEREAADPESILSKSSDGNVSQKNGENAAEGTIVEKIVEQKDIDEDKDRKLREFTADLWKSKKDYDIKILIGLHAFKVHKAILKEFSPVFAKHFAENEGKKIIDLDGFDPTIIEAMFEFCYTGSTKFFSSYDKTLSLHKVARQFEIGSLETKCLEVLMTMVNLENYSSVYTLMLQNKKNEGKSYSTQAFLQKIFELRKTNPTVLMDYKKDPELASLLVFEI